MAISVEAWTIKEGVCYYAINLEGQMPAWRRYSEFEAVHKAVRQYIPKLSVSLPPKAVIRKLFASKPVFVATRARALQTYIRRLFYEVWASSEHKNGFPPSTPPRDAKSGRRRLGGAMGARQVVANFILPRTGDDSFTALSVENSLNILHGRVGEGEEEGELTRGEIDRLDRCIKSLQGRVEGVEGIFRVTGSMHRQNILYVSLFTDTPFASDLPVIDIAGVLKRLLRERKQSLLTTEAYDKISRSSEDEKNSNVIEALHTIPTKNKRALVSLINLFKDISKSPASRMSLSNFAKIFAPALLPRKLPPQAIYDPQTHQTIEEFLKKCPTRAPPTPKSIQRRKSKSTARKNVGPWVLQGVSGELKEEAGVVQLRKHINETMENIYDHLENERLFRFEATLSGLRELLARHATRQSVANIDASNAPSMRQSLATTWLQRLEEDETIKFALSKSVHAKRVLEMFDRSDSEAWNLVRDHKNVKTWYRKEEGTPNLTFLVQGPIDPPLLNLAACLYEVDLYHSWFPFLKSATELKQVSRFHKQLHIVLKAPWPIWDREVYADCYGVNLLYKGELLICLRPLDPPKTLPPHLRQDLPRTTRNSPQAAPGTQKQEGKWNKRMLRGHSVMESPPDENSAGKNQIAFRHIRGFSMESPSSLHAAKRQPRHLHYPQSTPQVVSSDKNVDTLADMKGERIGFDGMENKLEGKGRNEVDEDRNRRKAVLASVKWGGFRIRKLKDGTSNISMLANVDPKLEVVSPALLNFIAGRLFHFMLVFLNTSASFGSDSKYAQRINSNPDVYEYIRTQVRDAKFAAAAEGSNSTVASTASPSSLAFTMSRKQNGVAQVASPVFSSNSGRQRRRRVTWERKRREMAEEKQDIQNQGDPSPDQSNILMSSVVIAFLSWVVYSWASSA